jgi:hypothetical protein
MSLKLAIVYLGIIIYLGFATAWNTHQCPVEVEFGEVIIYTQVNEQLNVMLDLNGFQYLHINFTAAIPFELELNLLNGQVLEVIPPTFEAILLMVHLNFNVTFSPNQLSMQLSLMSNDNINFANQIKFVELVGTTWTIANGVLTINESTQTVVQSFASTPQSHIAIVAGNTITLSDTGSSVVPGLPSSPTQQSADLPVQSPTPTTAHSSSTHASTSHKVVAENKIGGSPANTNQFTWVAVLVIGALTLILNIFF